ncbi:hypothetical protein DMN91_012592 [Ooceraea biroi]|uniref:Uncharacterized protein n=1 Tax=Ooceraea biroi TaxID=2015173 RepID=A0A3L8D2H0_OOCBI|nr:hypothetical protein DMN91_012592 [Ooceraea biroi]
MFNSSFSRQDVQEERLHCISRGSLLEVGRRMGVLPNRQDARHPFPQVIPDPEEHKQRNTNFMEQHRINWNSNNINQMIYKMAAGRIDSLKIPAVPTSNIVTQIDRKAAYYCNINNQAVNITANWILHVFQVPATPLPVAAAPALAAVVWIRGGILALGQHRQLRSHLVARNHYFQLQSRQSHVNCNYRYDISASTTTACASSYIADADERGANRVGPTANHTYNGFISENLSGNELNRPSITENNVQPYTTCSGQNTAILSPLLSTTSFTTSPTSTNARSIAASTTTSAAADALNGGVLSSLNIRNKTETEFHGVRAVERQPSVGESLPSSRLPFATSNLNTSLLSSLLTTSHISDICGNARAGRNTSDNDEDRDDGNNNERGNEEDDGKLLTKNIKIENYSPDTTPVIQRIQREQLEQFKQQESSVIRGIKFENTGLALDTDPVAKELHNIGARNTGGHDEGVGTIIGASNSYRNYTKQSSICAGSSSSGFFASHSSDAISPTSNIVTDMKYETQTGPPTTPSHLTSSGVEPPHSSQGTGIVVGGSPAEVVDSLLLSPWGATGQDFLEPSDVKQTTGLHEWDILLEPTVGVASAQSLAELKPLPPFTGYTGHLSINGIPGHHYHTIASSGQSGNGPSSEQDPEASRAWSDFDEWISIVSPRTQETTAPSTFSQIYVTTTPSTQAQQHGSTLQNLLSHNYAPLLQARLQAGNAASLQNASCGETPSSTSPYPISPSNQVSTSCSPEQQRQDKEICRFRYKEEDVEKHGQNKEKGREKKTDPLFLSNNEAQEALVIAHVNSKQNRGHCA